MVVAGEHRGWLASLRKRLDKTRSNSTANCRNTTAWPSGSGGRRASCDRRGAASRNGGAHRRPLPTAPGMFSHDRVDPGSRLLAEALPADLSGKVADFCAGWGYLSAEIASRVPKVTALDLYEADFASLEAAKPSIWCRHSRCRYAVLLARPARRAGRGPLRRDRHEPAVPPGPGGRARDRQQADRASRQRRCRAGGTLFLVANKGLPYERRLAAAFSRNTGRSPATAPSRFSQRRDSVGVSAPSPPSSVRHARPAPRRRRSSSGAGLPNR